MNRDGTGGTNLTSGSEEIRILEHSYRWSPDGSMIAFMKARPLPGDPNDPDDTWDIWVVRTDGAGEPTLVVEDATMPSWSPDGSKIAFETLLDFGQVWVINLDGTGLTRLTNESISSGNPVWSPDGARIAFVTFVNTSGRTEIVVMNADGRGAVNLTQGRGYDKAPTWSPDGARIAFMTFAEPRDQFAFEVAVMNSDGTGRANITNDPLSDDIDPTWSPDGREIAFARYFNDGTGGGFAGDIEIYVVNADGSGKRNISNRPEPYDTEPDW